MADGLCLGLPQCRPEPGRGPWPPAFATTRWSSPAATRWAPSRRGQAFHTLFIAASGNSELLRVTLDRRALIARFILLRGRATVSESGLREHRLMLDAFTRGDTADVLVRLDRLSAKLVASPRP